MPTSLFANIFLYFFSVLFYNITNKLPREDYI